MFICGRCAARLLKRNKPSTQQGRSLRKTRHSSTAARLSESGNVRPNVVHTRRQLHQDHRLWDGSTQITKIPGQSSRYTTSTTSLRPIRLAIVGSGPAGFYTASRVLKHQQDTKIDMYERLPVPFGLVRYGVAPDHPEVKNCQERFEEIAETPGFEFIGNVDVGGHLPLDVLKRHYDAILFTYGASEDRALGIEGEHLKGVWSARSFVAWYNGLPGYSTLDFDLDNAYNATIIGQGNVSLDIARILLTHVDKLRNTDVPGHVLEALSTSNVKHVAVVGRRGPLQVR
jgi:adrenodoxin-NADP+ reductase